MICDPCRIAGRLNKIASDPGQFADLARKLAREHHGQCKSGNRCDCQHVTGKVLKGTSDGT